MGRLEIDMGRLLATALDGPVEIMNSTDRIVNTMLGCPHR